MTHSFYKISLDIHDHGSHVSLKAKKGDAGRLLHITLMDDRKPYVITNECRAVFTAKKADGKILFNDCSIIGNTICYAFTPQTTAAVGKAECEIKLYGAEDKLLTSARFAIVVEDTVYNEGDEVESQKEVSALNKLISDATTLIADVKNKLVSGTFKGAKGDRGERGHHCGPLPRRNEPGHHHPLQMERLLSGCIGRSHQHSHLHQCRFLRPVLHGEALLHQELRRCLNGRN